VFVREHSKPAEQLTQPVDIKDLRVHGRAVDALEQRDREPVRDGLADWLSRVAGGVVLLRGVAPDRAIADLQLRSDLSDAPSLRTQSANLSAPHLEALVDAISSRSITFVFVVRSC
jgi:hypothetical protein